MKVARRPLGSSGVEVPLLCLGTMTFGTPLDQSQAAAVVDRALEASRPAPIRIVAPAVDHTELEVNRAAVGAVLECPAEGLDRIVEPLRPAPQAQSDGVVPLLPGVALGRRAF